MKKTFLLLSTLLASVFLLAVSCTNSSQITWKDNSSNAYTSDGLSELKVDVGVFSDNARTIYPVTWTEDYKKQLVFHLTGTTKDSSFSKSVTDMESHGRFFTYEMIRDNEAKVKLDPTTWNLTLNVYSANPDEIALIKSNLEAGTKPTFETGGLGNLKDKKTLTGSFEADLTKGATEATFNLASAPGTTAVGDVNVEINFLNPTSVRIKNLKIEILKEDLSLSSPVKDEVASTDFAKAGSDGYYFHAFTKNKVPAGIYTFDVQFLDENNKVVLRNRQDIIIEGGNKSEATIDLLDENAYGTIPKKPINVEYSTYYKPASTPIEIDVHKKIYAEDLVDATSREKNYNIDISWIDTADNEFGYKVILTPTAGNAVDFSYDPADNKGIISNNKTVSGNAVSCTGSLGAIKKGDKGKITITAPLTVAFNKIEVMALNPYVHEVNDHDAVTAIITPDSEIGMFTVTYNLKQSANGVNGADTIVTYKDSGTTANQYFVMGYPYGTTVDQLVKGSGKYPFVSLANYEFGSWMKETKSNPAFANVEDADLEIGKLLATGNIELKAAWLTNASIKVVFPDYTEYKNLKATEDNSVNGNVIKPKNETVTLTLPQANITEPTFKIVRDSDNKTIFVNDPLTPNADTELGITLSTGAVAGDTLTWDVNTFLTNYPTAAGGVYRVEITYNYNSGASKYTGNLYVDLSI